MFGPGRVVPGELLDMVHVAMEAAGWRETPVDDGPNLSVRAMLARIEGGVIDDE